LRDPAARIKTLPLPADTARAPRSYVATVERGQPDRCTFSSGLGGWRSS